MAEDWELDTGLEVLIGDILALPGCTVRRSEIGTIGDAAHQARKSAHNPEHPAPPGNPDYEVDAIDPPHAPDRGLDCAELTEALRQSRDPRLYLVIFNGRQFSSYAHDGIPPFTWRPYSGDDMHRTHAHVEVNDTHHGDTSHWKVTTMADATHNLDSPFKQFIDANSDGKIEVWPLYTFIVAAHAEAVRARNAGTAAEGKGDEILTKLAELTTAAAVASFTDEQVVLFAKTVAAELAAKLTVTFTPTAPATGTAE